MPPRAGEGQPCASEWARRRRRAGGSAASFSAAKRSRRVGGAAFDPHWRGASSLPWKEAVASLAAPPRGPRGVGVLRRPDRPSFRQVNETLYRQGYATVHDLQLLRVDFNSNYEESPLQRRAARQRCVREEITQLRGVNRTPSPTSSCRSSSRSSRGAMPEAIRRLLRLHSQPPFTGDQDVPARSDAGEQRGRHPVGRGGGGHRAHQRAGAARGERHNQPGERLIIN